MFLQNSLNLIDTPICKISGIKSDECHVKLKFSISLIIF